MFDFKTGPTGPSFLSANVWRRINFMISSHQTFISPLLDTSFPSCSTFCTTSEDLAYLYRVFHLFALILFATFALVTAYNTLGME